VVLFAHEEQVAPRPAGLDDDARISLQHGALEIAFQHHAQDPASAGFIAAGKFSASSCPVSSNVSSGGSGWRHPEVTSPA
jgi:hypothetical protein